MTYIRKAEDRGRANFGWLDSKHSFSFGNYHDPAHMGYGVLRVINDDRVAPAGGFGTHGHQDMEIVTYVIDGSLEHKDSMGNAGLITAGEVQRMSAGTGVQHSEMNGSTNDPVHFLQIWIEPAETSTEPAYEQKRIEQRETLTPLVTEAGSDETLAIGQNAKISRLRLKPGETFTLPTERLGYLHVVIGDAVAGDMMLKTGDGLGSEPGDTLTVASKTEFEALWFELPS